MGTGYRRQPRQLTQVELIAHQLRITARDLIMQADALEASVPRQEPERCVQTELIDPRDGTVYLITPNRERRRRT